MGEQNDGRIVRHLPQGRAEIVDADALDRTVSSRDEVGQLISETRDPERVTILGQAPYVVLIDRNACSLERAPGSGLAHALALHRPILPVVVIAEDRMNAERRLQSGKN